MFVHRVRPRYAEVDLQGVVFNAHWLTYFDEACTRFFEHLGFDAAKDFFESFDVMLVKAVLEWQGPAGFDELVDIDVAVAASARSPSTCGTARPSATGLRRGVITYVSVVPGTHDSTPIPDALRARLVTESVG